MNLKPAAVRARQRICGLSKETEVVTREGIRPISSLVGGPHDVLVPALNAYRKPSTNGGFKPVEFRCFGEERLYEVRLHAQRRRHDKVVYASASQRWFVSSRSARGDKCSIERSTVDLECGDRLKNLLAQHVLGCSEVPFAVAQGFVFGDGTKPFGERPATLTIYSNGKDDALLPYFPRHSFRTGANGARVVYGLPRTWKSLPTLAESRSFLLSWLAGYFAADGCVAADGVARLDSAKYANIVFARDLAEICGVGHGSPRSTMRSGFGNRPSAIYGLNLNPRDLPSWFFVLATHAKRAQPLQAAGRPGAERVQWSVRSVSPTNRVEPVYGAYIAGAGAFGLVDNLMAGDSGRAEGC